MKKIENIVDNCIDCRFARRYCNHDENRKIARICVRMNPARLAGFDGTKGIVEIPDWCPLETYKETEVVEESSSTKPATVIIDAVPSLEWAAENLTGHGGTEVDGRWYYTWERAMAAAAELGDGWRLPTIEEFKALADAGSVWDAERKGRLFGGKLFLEAAGFSGHADGALYGVGSSGSCWSSSPYSSAGVCAGFLYFNDGRIVPVYYDNRAYGFSVRCVRDIK